MARGGKRDGAGRKAGAPNKASALREAEVAASGTTPLEYMLAIMRDDLSPAARRDDMAKAAAPYVHPKLAAVEHSGPDGGPIEVSNLTDAQLAAIATGRGARTVTPPKGKN
jgi:hypothetical protein